MLKTVETATKKRNTARRIGVGLSTCNQNNKI